MARTKNVPRKSKAQPQAVAAPEVAAPYSRPLERLPIKGMDEYRPALEALGFKIGEPWDDLFLEVEAPEGWRMQYDEGSMHQSIRDPSGRRRGYMFLKTPYYDREAFFSLGRRYHIDLQHDPLKLPVIEKRKRVKWTDANGMEVPAPAKMVIYGDAFYGYDDGGLRHSSPRRETVTENVVVEEGTPYKDQLYRWVVKDHSDPDGEPLFVTEWSPNSDRGGEGKRQSCKAWLDENRPEHEDYKAYWDDEAPQPAPAV